jgi:serine protease Do
MAVLDEIQQVVARAVERVGPAVVGLGRGWRPGSGVVVAADRVLTNAHNLRGDEATVTFGDGRRDIASVTGIDINLDLAVLELDTGDVVPVEWPSEPGSPETATTTRGAAGIGTPIVALANPGGRGLRVTWGLVSATSRSFRGPGGRRITGCIEHTAPLPRGSSGGPLVDQAGRLLGLNTIRLEGGLLVAVPSAQRQVDALARGETKSRARLGVAVAPPYVARRLRRAVGLPEEEGVLVRSVQGSSAAARAGVVEGDLIVAAGGRQIASLDALYETLDAIDRDSLELEIVRGTERIKLLVSFEDTRTAEEVEQ